MGAPSWRCRAHGYTAGEVGIIILMWRTAGKIDISVSDGSGARPDDEPVDSILALGTGGHWPE